MSPKGIETIEKFSLKDLTLYFLRLGTVGFGGPIALVGYMERDLVEQRQWIEPEQFKRGLALSQLAPGPLAAQLAIYIGFLKARILGATLIGLAFVLPSFLMVVALGMLYTQYGGLDWIRALFYGIGAAVIGIIAKSAYKLIRTTLGKKALLWVIFGVMALVTAYTGNENIVLFLLSGILALFLYAPPKLSSPPKSLLTVGFPAITASDPLFSDKLVDIFLFFAKAGAFIFGSGLAIVPFLYGGVVQEYHWLTEQQFLDAVAVAMITPGPVVITVGFIGYLVSGFPGAVIAALGVFLPVYLFVILPAPYFEKYAHNRQLIAFVEGVTSAAIGAIAGAVYVLGTRALIDIPTVLLAVAALIILTRFKIPEPAIIFFAGLFGLFFYHFR